MGLGLMKRQQLKKALLIGAISISIALSSIGGFAVNKSPIARLLIRDAVIATVAHHMAGEKILVAPDYTDFMLSNAMTESNSLWVLNYSQIIVPFFEHENIREVPVYAKEIIVEPLVYEEGSFYVAGYALYETKHISIFLGEHHDARQLLAVLIHEHIHLQGGRFIDVVPPWLNVVVFEANTQAATLEVLAAMCHSGDDIACTAFWNEVKHYSSCAFWVRLQQIEREEWYQPIARLLWPGHIDFQQASPRLVYIYLQYPWEQIITPGILGEALDTGNLYTHEISDGNFVCRKLFMPFDDTEYLLGWLDRFIEWITPE